MIFYKGPTGRLNNAYSHSQNQAAKCPRRYYLFRHEGWKSYPPGAALDFGKCVEAAVRASFEQSADAIEHFAALWAKHKDDKLDYRKDVSWEHLNEVGQELMRVFCVSFPRWGIKDPRFYNWKSRQSKKDFVKDSPLDAILDMVDWPDPHPRWGDGGRITDIKTKPSPLPEEIPNLISLDEQLRTYSWVTGMERVALMVFVKSGPKPRRGAGTKYTIMADFGEWKAGDVVTCAPAPKDKKVAASEKKAGIFRIIGKDCVQLVSGDHLSGCRVQYIEGRMDTEEVKGTISRMRVRAEDLAESWKLIQQLKSEIPAGVEGKKYDELSRSAMIKAYAQVPGMQFPSNECVWCPVLGHCLKDKKLLDEKARKLGDEWMEGLDGEE